MTSIVWLASYPKSGNTWFRIFLTNYLRDATEPASINDLDDAPNASARAPLDWTLGYECSDLNHEEAERLRPDFYLHVARRSHGPLFFKVHDAYTRLPDGRPLLPPEATHAALYFVRNPLDVCVSFSHHGGHDDHGHTAGLMACSSFCLCDVRQRYDLQVRQRLLSWGEHARSWLDASGIRIKVLRYEDMHFAAEETFGAALRFIGVELAMPRLRKALEFSCFTELRRQEDSHGFKERLPKARTFFRTGQVGRWRESLPTAVVEKVIADHGPMMQRLGYLDAHGAVVF
jgi:aryl sulfotransferase